MNYGKKLKELRKENNLTQKDIAKVLECNQSMIVRWEKLECQPTEEIIRKTAIFFQVTADYLLGLEDDYGNKINTAKYYNSFNNSNINNSNFK